MTRPDAEKMEALLRTLYDVLGPSAVICRGGIEVSRRTIANVLGIPEDKDAPKVGVAFTKEDKS